MELTTDVKGTVAEAAIVYAAVEDFEFGARLAHLGAIAQLGERLDGIQKVAGSSPAGSTS